MRCGLIRTMAMHRTQTHSRSAFISLRPTWRLGGSVVGTPPASVGCLLLARSSTRPHWKLCSATRRPSQRTHRRTRRAPGFVPRRKNPHGSGRSRWPSGPRAARSSYRTLSSTPRSTSTSLSVESLGGSASRQRSGPCLCDPVQPRLGPTARGASCNRPVASGEEDRLCRALREHGPRA